MEKYLVVSNRDIQNGKYFESPEALEDYLEAFGDYNGIHTLVFPFWSWKVPSHILAKYKCYGFHTGFLLDGKGKGGSPIDNLQRLGIRWAALNVFEMNERFDEGKVRLATPISLNSEKKDIIWKIDMMIPVLVQFLMQDISNVPEVFKRLPDAK